MSKVYLHWTWGSDQRDEFAMVEVIFSLKDTLTEEELEAGQPAIHVARTEMDTLMFQLCQIGLAPAHVNITGEVMPELPIHERMDPAPPNLAAVVTKKKEMTARQGIIGILFLVLIFWLIVGPFLWFFGRK